MKSGTAAEVDVAVAQAKAGVAPGRGQQHTDMAGERKVLVLVCFAIGQLLTRQRLHAWRGWWRLVAVVLD